MLPTIQQLSLIGGRAANENMDAINVGLDVYGGRAGLYLPHRLAHYLAQLAHESAAFKYDEEIASGAAYEGRKDLGNTVPGDGVRYKGRGPIQITGRANYTAFRDWCRAQAGVGPVPDFVAEPQRINTQPWEGLVPIWYWTTRNLNRYADKNDIEMITRRINGGMNGFDDRVRYYTRAALVLLGFAPTAVKTFQQSAGLTVDGIAGPQTRAALHKALVALGGDSAGKVETQTSPVVEEKVVAPEGAAKRGWLWGPLSGISLSGMINTFADFPWQIKLGISIVAFVLVIAMLFVGERIIRRTKELIKEASK